jgi:hypothetical protein
MEAHKEQASPLAIGIRFGLLIAVVGVLVDFLTRIAGLSVLAYGIVAGASALVVGVVGIVLAHKAFKHANGGLMTYGQGVIIALVMLLISSFISSVFNYLYVNYVDPSYIENMKAQMTEFMERSNVPEDQIAKSTAKFDEMNPAPLMMLVNALKNGLIGGTILGAIISIFTKRKPADFE